MLMFPETFPFQNDRLIAEEEWKAAIDALSTSFDDLETNKERVKRRLAESIKTSVGQATAGQKTGILLSGGVDSTLLSLLAKQGGADITCYAVGLEGSQDIAWAQQAARLHDLPLVYKVLSLQELERITKKLVSLFRTTDIVTIGVGIVTYAASRLAQIQQRTHLMTGLGSEELFAGYQRHKDALEQGMEAVHQECRDGLKACYTRDILRDTALAKNLGLTIAFPYLHPAIIKGAMRLHPMCKLDATGEKLILRELAQELGLAKEIAWRKKTAAQYGSSVIKGLDRLVSQKGFSGKKEWLESMRRDS